MIAVTHFADVPPDFADRGRAALAALADRPGYLRGTLARSTDDPRAWLLFTEWRNVGSYRRALGDYAVKLHATPLMSAALELPAGFEPLLDVTAGGGVVEHGSDREPTG